MKKLVGIFLLSIAFQASAQQRDSIWNFAKTITAEELKTHLYVIASDDMEGRETGKAGQKKAMNYLIKNFKSYGINDFENRAYKQSFPLAEQEQTGVSLKIGDENFTFNKEFTVTPSFIKKTAINGEVIFVGSGIEDENYNSYKNLDVKDKAVLILNINPKKGELSKKWTLKEKIELAKKKGASIIFYHNEKLDENLKKYEHYYHKPQMKLVDDIKEETIVLALSTSVVEKILEENNHKLKKLQKKGVKEKMRFSTTFDLLIDKPTTQLTGENVLAFIPGTDLSEEVLVITAHYDHIGKEGDEVFNGADDDGSGTVALLEIAQAFQEAVKQGKGPRRSILIMPVSGEEKGLLGSKYYTNHPVFELDNTVANLNIDMIGRLDKAHESNNNYIYLIGSDKLSSELHSLSENANETYTNIELDYTFNDENDPNRFYYRSDHYNFAKNGIPVIFYFNGVHADYHKATDTVEKIDYEKMENITRLIFVTAWEIANRNERIVVDQEMN